MVRARSRATGIALAALVLCEHALARAAEPGPAPFNASAVTTRARRVALLDVSEPLARALRTALVPWGMQLERVARDTPETSVPGSALRARELAQELGADVLVWVSSNSEGAALWIYEAADDSIRARPCPAQPVDDARAAALALSVKTWLRLPEQPPPALAPPPAALVARTLPVLYTSADLERHVQPHDEIPESVPPKNVNARVSLHAAARAGALKPTRLQAHYGIELRAIGWHDSDHARRWWLAARFDTGAPATVHDDSFRGEHQRWGAGLATGLGQRLLPWVHLNVLAGLSLDRATLTGTLLPEGTAVERARWQPVAQLRPELELELAPVALLLQPTLCASPRQQRFLAGGSEVLSTRPFWWSLGAAISLDLL